MEEAQKIKFSGKVALVVGATSGIGRETAIQFALSGAKVVLAGRRSNKGIEAADEIRKLGGEASFIEVDMSSEGQVKSLINKTIALYGQLDYAFNNGAIEGERPSSESDRQEMVIVGPRCAHQLIGPMVEGGNGQGRDIASEDIQRGPEAVFDGVEGRYQSGLFRRERDQLQRHLGDDAKSTQSANVHLRHVIAAHVLDDLATALG